MENQTEASAKDPKEKGKKEKCNDCYYNMNNVCVCGESKNVNKILFFFSKACDCFKRN